MVFDLKSETCFQCCDSIIEKQLVLSNSLSHDKETELKKIELDLFYLTKPNGGTTWSKGAEKTVF